MLRRDEETRYIISNKGIQRNLYRMAELQAGFELSVYCPYSKVRPEDIYPFPKYCHLTTDLGHASYDLPDDVFSLGEAKPTRPKKKVNKKRDLDAMEVRLKLPSVERYPRIPRRLSSLLIANERLLW